MNKPFTFRKPLPQLLALSMLIPLMIAIPVSGQGNRRSSTGKGGIIEQAAWLQGAWCMQSKQGIILETWEQLNDSVYAGRSYYITGKDTVPAETISLQQRSGKLYYIPTVNNQNEGKPVNFAATTVADDHFVFENPGHDFPQKISYTRISPDSMVVEISGISKGKQHSIKFPMKRLK